MLAEYAKLSREAAAADENYEEYLLRLSPRPVNTSSYPWHDHPAPNDKSREIQFL